MTYKELEALVDASPTFLVGHNAIVLQCLDGSWGVRELKFFETEGGIGAKSRYGEMVPQLVKHAFDHEKNPFAYIGHLLANEVSA